MEERDYDEDGKIWKVELLVNLWALMDFFLYFLYQFLTDVEYFETELHFQEAAKVLECESKQGDESLWIRKNS